MPDGLQAHWDSLTTALHLPACPQHLHEVLTRWQEPQRHYHTLAHLLACVHLVARHWGAFEQPAAVLLGLFYHDAVYDPKRHDNEAQSALLLQAHWQGVMAPTTLARIGGWILATATHAGDGLDGDGLRFLDVDLAVLSSAPADYGRYARQVRAEYGWVANADYRQGRAAVLQGFLKRPVLYHTPLLGPLAEAQARANLSAELEHWLHSDAADALIF